MSASTRVAAVIGHPVRHSLSPAIFNAAFAAVGLDWAYLAFDVAEGHGGDAVRASRILGIDGLSVTMPHKAAAAAAVDQASDRALALDAVNCVSRRGDRLVGDNTDGPGFVASLRLDGGFDPQGTRCLVLGAGGAARAIVLALAEAGASEIVVVNRTEATAHVAVALAPGIARIGVSGDASHADLVVNATSIGMAHPDDPERARSLPIDAAHLGAGQVVADIVYHPLRTALLDAAASRGATVVEGLGMLVHQAALAFTIWTGEPAPLELMWAAARRNLPT
ncbi:MAG: shikimate dehydrogenase [Acidimicrobiia bacterium]|nr:shikimate dehydrogenase [Acidimicrobiia bacterium]